MTDFEDRTIRALVPEVVAQQLQLVNDAKTPFTKQNEIDIMQSIRQTLLPFTARSDPNMKLLIATNDAVAVRFFYNNTCVNGCNQKAYQEKMKQFNNDVEALCSMSGLHLDDKSHPSFTVPCSPRVTEAEAKQRDKAFDPYHFSEMDPQLEDEDFAGLPPPVSSSDVQNRAFSPGPKPLTRQRSTMPWE